MSKICRTGVKTETVYREDSTALRWFSHIERMDASSQKKWPNASVKGDLKNHLEWKQRSSGWMELRVLWVKEELGWKVIDSVPETGMNATLKSVCPYFH